LLVKYVFKQVLQLNSSNRTVLVGVVNHCLYWLEHTPHDSSDVTAEAYELKLNTLKTVLHRALGTAAYEQSMGKWRESTTSMPQREKKRRYHDEF
jgi:hypothetical protein